MSWWGLKASQLLLTMNQEYIQGHECMTFKLGRVGNLYPEDPKVAMLISLSSVLLLASCVPHMVMLLECSFPEVTYIAVPSMVLVFSWSPSRSSPGYHAQFGGIVPIFFYLLLRCSFLFPTVVPVPNYFLVTLCPEVRRHKGLLQLPSLREFSFCKWRQNIKICYSTEIIRHTR